jgi:hypothetical protein
VGSGKYFHGLSSKRLKAYRLDGAIFVVDQFVDFHVAYISQAARECAAEIEEIPLALNLNDGGMGSPTKDGIEV